MLPNLMRHRKAVGDDVMQDFLLIITVVAFMIFGFFIMGKVDKFFAENYKGFEDDENEGQDIEDSVKNDENEDNSLR